MQEKYRFALETLLLDDDDKDDKKTTEAATSTGVLVLGGENEKIQISVHFPELHERIQARINSLNQEFFEVKEKSKALASSSSSSNTSLTGHLALAVGMDYSQAKEVWKLANHFFTTSLNFFVLDGYCSDHVVLLQRLSSCYRHLQTWESDSPVRKVAMLTRRHKMLVPLLSELSKKHFIAQWQQICFESAEAFMEIAETHLGTVNDQNADPKKRLQAAHKSNSAAQSSRSLFAQFCSTFTEELKKDPDTLDKENASCWMSSKMNAARLGHKLIGADKKSRVDILRACMCEYEELKRWLDICPGAKSFTEENRMVKEMCSLLPVQLERELRASN